MTDWSTGRPSFARELKDVRVLVTGGTGFIGGHVVPRLLAEGARVTLAVPAEERSLVPDGASFAPMDLRDRASLAALAACEPEIVLHLAGYSLVGESVRHLETCFDLNARGTALLVAALPGARAFVYASTAHVYDARASVPYREDGAIAPASPYAVSKYAGELAALAAGRAREGRQRVAALRLFNVFGPGQRPPAIVPELVRGLLSDASVRTTPGAQTRDFVYVDDVVDAVLAAIARSDAQGPINVCSGREVAIGDLARTVARLVGREDQLAIGAVPYRPGEIMRAYGDGRRAEILLGWSPSVSLEDGLARTVAHARENPGVLRSPA